MYTLENIGITLKSNNKASFLLPQLVYRIGLASVWVHCMTTSLFEK